VKDWQPAGIEPATGRSGPVAPRLLAATLTVVVWLAGCAPQTQTPPATETRPTLASPRADTLDLLTFNAALLPGVVASTNQAERARLMAPHLHGYDVLVLQELFVDAWRERLLSELESAYPYRTELVGKDGARGNPLRQDGGIVILSRWPITRQAQMTFGGVCSGSDCLGDKGVAYAEVRKGEFSYHVFGTHAQSEFGFRVEQVRAAQFALMRAFVDEQGIPASEPVILAGDFNVDAYTPELASMLGVLNAVRPITTGVHRFTWDPERNVWARGQQQWIDYVLFAADHVQPVAAWNRVVQLRAGTLDLSDHFAVWGRVVMGSGR